ncbi:MAG: hypothetical protein KDB27_05210 [Planctomycetales bacterium]|nr:hypothetical protein [Planctomycetales bacterium]
MQRSYSNRSGTLLLILPSSGVEMADVATAVSTVLEKQFRKPSALSVDQRNEALSREEWRDADRIGELTSIEIRTLVLRALGYALPVLLGATFAVVWWRRIRGAKNAR